MTKVVLYGALAEAVGRKEWFLSVSSVQEALKAIEANTNKLYAFLLNHGNGETPYHILVNKKPVKGVEQCAITKNRIDEIVIMPALAGAGSGGLLAIIGAVLVLIAITIFTWGVGTAPAAATASGFMGSIGFTTAGASLVASTTLMMGLSLMLAGLSQVLTPTEKANGTNSPSYIFNGTVNTTRQGVAIPVGYGELLVGSATISVGLSSETIPLE